MKLSATRSAVRIERTAPAISITVSPLRARAGVADDPHFQLRIDAVGRPPQVFNARGDRGFLCKDACRGALRPDEIPRRQIARPDVLGERDRDGVVQILNSGSCGHTSCLKSKTQNPKSKNLS